MLQNMNHPTGKHVCNVCNIEMKRLFNIVTHVKAAHGIVSKNVCKLCTTTKRLPWTIQILMNLLQTLSQMMMKQQEEQDPDEYDSDE